MLAVAVTLTLAWGVFGTRLSVIEDKSGDQKELNQKVEKKVEDHAKRLDRLESNQQADELAIDNLYDKAKVPDSISRESS